MTEKDSGMPHFPIVLWSVDKKMQDSYYRDETAHDLFDQAYIKQAHVNKEPARVAEELISLSKGYQKILSSDSFHKMLGLSKEEGKNLDPRLGSKFLFQKKYPTHEYARYILRELIDIEGPLINEFVLAARLGVDKDSSPDWEKCKLILSKKAGYSGAFYEAWPRWWAAKIELWWNSLSDSPGLLSNLRATERVKYLRSSTTLKKLKAAEPIENSYSDRYWTICQAYKKPLDPIDGFRKSYEELKPWQEPPYLSFLSILNRTAEKEGFKIHPLERSRFNKFRIQREKDVKRN